MGLTAARHEPRSERSRYPKVSGAIVDRINERGLRLAVTQPISQLNRVDRRLLARFRHLAERWGRMTSDGVALPLTLSHRMLGQLVGAPPAGCGRSPGRGGRRSGPP